IRRHICHLATNENISCRQIKAVLGVNVTGLQLRKDDIDLRYEHKIVKSLNLLNPAYVEFFVNCRCFEGRLIYTLDGGSFCIGLLLALLAAVKNRFRNIELEETLRLNQLHSILKKPRPLAERGAISIGT
uniref:Uncharacterized protein n=1 Tax=Glossina palpalis gambiensis TaxID=67801 RepID=A0A1B0BVE6_9MUSC